MAAPGRRLTVRDRVLSHRWILSALPMGTCQQEPKSAPGSGSEKCTTERSRGGRVEWRGGEAVGRAGAALGRVRAVRRRGCGVLALGSRRVIAFCGPAAGGRGGSGRGVWGGGGPRGGCAGGGSFPLGGAIWGG